MSKKNKNTLDYFNDNLISADEAWQDELKKFKPLKLLPSKKKSKDFLAKVKTSKNSMAIPPNEDWDNFAKSIQPLPSKYKNTVPKKLEKVPFNKTSTREINVNNYELNNYHLGEISRKDLKKIKANKIVINKTLDLHNYTTTTAEHCFYEFIIDAFYNSDRLVQIITGKGNNSKNTSKGILRNAFLQWITDSKLKPYILSYSPIYDMAGDYGSFYIFLRKNKTNL